MEKILGMLAVSSLILTGCQNNIQASTETSSQVGAENSMSNQNINSEKVSIEDLSEGQGSPAENNDLLLVEYTGKFSDGKVFDTNTKPGMSPFGLFLGKHMVIEGWEQGLQHMKKGGQRKIIIPWQLAYGEEGIPSVIPPKTDLHFEVKLLDLIKKDKLQTLGIQVIQPGRGLSAKAGQRLTVHYTGKLVNNKKFDSSLDRKTPFEFQLGAGQVIKGWDQGFDGMQIGEKRLLHIPPSLGYGERGSGPIGPNQVLIFEVELLGIK